MSCRKVLVIVERYSVGMANDIWGIFGLQGRSDNVCMCVLPEIQKKKRIYIYRINLAGLAVSSLSY